MTPKNKNEESAVEYQESYRSIVFGARYSLTVTKSSVSFGFSFFCWGTQIIDRSMIVSATPSEYVHTTRGYGIFPRGRTADGHPQSAYLARDGGLVTIEVRGNNNNNNSNTWYVFSCNEPQIVCDLLQCKDIVELRVG